MRLPKGPQVAFSIFLTLPSLLLFSQSSAASNPLQLSPTILRFGEVEVGQSESLSATMTNTGSTSINVSSISTSTKGYSLSYPTLPLTLAAGQSITMSVRFSPAAIGNDAGSVWVNTNAVYLPLRGTGTSSSTLLANPASVAFGSVQVGSSAQSTVTLTNGKASNVSISGDSLKGAGFSVEGLTFPLTIAAGQSFTFVVAFSPPAAGMVNGSFQALNASNSALITIPLTATGTPAGQLTMSPTSEAFGSVNVGSSSTQNGSLMANGTTVTVTSATSSSSEFAIAGISFPITIAAGQSIPYSLTFTPQMSGAASATLSFASNASDPSLAESLSGTGVAHQYSVVLTWTGSTSQVTGYNVYRSGASGGPFTKINSALDGNTTYTDATISTSQTYYYVTTAVDPSGNESSYSNQVQVVIP